MKYLRVKRNDTAGSYVQPLSEARNICDGEFADGEVGTKVILELIEMTEEEYEKLPEFNGW